MHCAAIFVRRVVHFLDGLRNGANQARGGCAGASGRRRPCRPRRRCVEASTHRLQLLHQSLSFALVLQGIDDLIERLRQRRAGGGAEAGWALAFWVIAASDSPALCAAPARNIAIRMPTSQVKTGTRSRERCMDGWGVAGGLPR
jgi:hypothetical protein